jgi:uncharacterized membrane protein YraQ (UPF0718 family)
MTTILKKYWFTILVCLSLGLLLIFYPLVGQKACVFTGKTLVNFLLTIPPIFVCIGLLDVWVDKEHMMKALGENSGIRGVLSAFLFGVITAVPLYALLPIAGILLKKECKLGNVLIFICACASIRIPLLLFEVSALGWKFTLTRFLSNVMIVLGIAWLIERMISKKDKIELYRNVNKL